MPFLKTIIAVVVLTALGYLGNVVSLPVAFSVNFLFGSIFVIIAVSLFGPLLGGLSALIASSYTVIIWNHPYAIVIFVCEALWVGFFLKRKYTNIVLIDAAYWLVIGLPLVFIFYFGVMSLGFQSTAIIFLKQSTNAILNALIATILISHLPWQKWLRFTSVRQKVPYSQIIFQLTSTFLMIPLIGMLIFTNYQEAKTIQTVAGELLVAESKEASDLIHSWLERHIVAVETIAKLGKDHHFQPSEKLQSSLGQINSLFTDFHTVFIADNKATTVAFIPAINEKGEKTIGINFSDRESFKQLKSTLKPVISNVFQGRGGVFVPIFSISVPIIEEGKLLGFGQGAVNLDKMRNLLDQSSYRNDVVLTVIDQHDNIVCSTNPLNPSLTPIKQKSGGQTLMIGKDVGLWTPSSKKNISIMDVWKDATYFVTLPIAGTKWTLLTEASVAPLQGYLYQATIVNLILISCLFVVAIILSQIVGKRLVRTPVRLAAISRDIPIKLEKHSELIWPVSNISEMHFLIENFKETTEALSLQYQNIKDTNIHLEERVQRRTTELRESEAKYRLIAENTADLISIMDRNLRFTYVSPASMRLLGFTAEEAMERTLEQVLTPESMRLCLTVFEKEMQLEASGTADPDRTRILELEEYKKDGSIIWVEVNLSFIRDNDRKPINILIVSRDITVRKRAEEKLRESENRFRQLADSTWEGIMIHREGIILDINESILKMSGWQFEEIIGKSVLEFLASESIESALQILKKSVDTPQIYLEAMGLRKDKTVFPIEVLGRPIRYKDLDARVLAIRDLTERKHLGEALRESAEKYKRLVENINDVIYEIDRQGVVIYISPVVRDIMGYSQADVIGKNFIEFVYEDDRSRLIERFFELNDGIEYPFDYRLISKSGDIIWVRTKTKPLMEGDSFNGARGTLIDITDRKQAEAALRESEERFRSITESLQEAVWYADLSGKFIFLSPIMAHIYGRPLSDMKANPDFWVEASHPENQASVLASKEALLRDDHAELEYRIILPDSTVRWIADRKLLLRNEHGEPCQIAGIVSDITERKQAEEKIQASLLEKETMLKEIHHRVKNNLQVISSLLNIQSSHLQDEKAKEALQESIERVGTMASIHTQLYESEDLTRIDFGSFIGELIGNIRQVYGRAESPVGIKVDADEISLGIETSIPCGLILNELVSNALKHAFPEGRKGELHIRMRSEDKRMTLTVQDNGIGFPESIDLTKLKSLGMDLVNILVRQMKGKMDMRVDGGTTWTITFPVKDEREWQNG